MELCIRYGRWGDCTDEMRMLGMLLTRATSMEGDGRDWERWCLSKDIKISWRGVGGSLDVTPAW